MSQRQGEICEYTDIGTLLSKRYYDENGKLTKSELYDDKQNVVYTLDLSNNEYKETIDHPLITMTRINGEIIGNYKVSNIEINSEFKNYYSIFNQKKNDKYFYDIMLELIKLTSKFKYELIKQYNCKEDKLDGEYKRFENDKLIEHCYYKKGKLDGEYIKYKDDYIIIKCSYKDGKKNGDYKKYNNGILVEHFHYQTIGKLDDIDEIKVFKDGKLIKQYYCNNGVFKYEKEQLDHGYNYLENIFVVNKYTYCYGKKNGEYKEYDDDGNLVVHCNYINDKLNGEYKEYDDNKNLIKHCNYVDNKIDVDFLVNKKNEDHKDEDSIEDKYKNKKSVFKLFNSKQQKIYSADI